jgi:hypothetical protein
MRQNYRHEPRDSLMFINIEMRELVVFGYITTPTTLLWNKYRNEQEQFYSVCHCNSLGERGSLDPAKVYKTV